MKKQTFLSIIICLGIGIALILLITNYIFNSGDKLNEGKFRISDAIVTSMVDMKNNVTDGTGWNLDVSMSNELAVLIDCVEGSEIKEIYIDSARVTKAPNKGTVNISQPKYDLKQDLTGSGKRVDIYSETRDDGQKLIEIEILSENILNNYALPEETTQIRHDGTVFTFAGLGIKDVQFTVKFNLNVVETTGKVNRCEIELKLPSESLLTTGQSVTRLKTTDFPFKVKN